MAFGEVSVTQVREVLRRWLRDDEGLRLVATGVGVDRKTARRYVDAAVALGLDRSGGEDQLTDELISGVCEAVRAARSARSSGKPVSRQRSSSPVPDAITGGTPHGGPSRAEPPG
jgi:hypothetical protein